ncbi:response regulator [bacterium]|nr:MAG: response regulator [bacterium]
MENVEKIIEWLCKIENAAFLIYEKASKAFSGDEELSSFLQKLAEDEKAHLGYMQKAFELIQGSGKAPHVIAFDKNTVEFIEKRFSACEKVLETDAPTKKDIFNFIVETEFSEWNTLFLYVINVLLRSHVELKRAVINIHRHEKSIERFFESKPELSEYRERLKTLHKIWAEKILVADREGIICDVLKAVLDDEANVDCAADGKTALEMFSATYYSAIISDYDSLRMDGIEFYKNAILKFPACKDRFIFFVDVLTREQWDFFRKNNIKCLKKPSQIKDVKKAVIKILEKKSE